MVYFFSVDFWPRTAVAQEHPEVRFNNKLYAEMLFIDDSDKNAVTYHTYEYSTLKPIKDQG